MALSKIDADGLNIGQIGGSRNKVINGSMVIDQRNSGSSVTVANDSTVTLDRFLSRASPANRYSVQQSSTSPNGFINSLVVTSSSAATIGSSDFAAQEQRIEGLNVVDLAWGTADAKTVTLSFWVRSSLTGTFGGALGNGAFDRSYPYSYTISSADTWEHKTITIEGDTTGTWLTTNGIGVRVWFSFGTGSTYLGTAGAWTGSGKIGATGETALTATNGATLYITGVQLEVGDTATPFEHRSYGEELALCQRYCWVKPANGNYEDDLIIPAPYNNDNNNRWASVFYPVQMRARPTLQNATWGAGTPATINEGLWWVSLQFTNGIHYVDENTGFTLEAEL